MLGGLPNNNISLKYMTHDRQLARPHYSRVECEQKFVFARYLLGLLQLWNNGIKTK